MLAEARRTKPHKPEASARTARARADASGWCPRACERYGPLAPGKAPFRDKDLVILLRHAALSVECLTIRARRTQLSPNSGGVPMAKTGRRSKQGGGESGAAAGGNATTAREETVGGYFRAK